MVEGVWDGGGTVPTVRRSLTRESRKGAPKFADASQALGGWEVNGRGGRVRLGWHGGRGQEPVSAGMGAE